MDYNTSRKKLLLPEYGRNIQKMVDYVKSIDDKNERNRMANIVIGIMGNMNPHLRDVGDFKHKLWDHLHIMSDFEIDIDSPYPPPDKEELYEKPKRLPYNTHKFKYRHFGHIIKELIQTAKEYPEGEDKKHLIRLIANHMKKSYLMWNKETVTDDVIVAALEEMSDGKLTIPVEELSDSKDLLSKNKRKRGKGNR